MAKIKSASRTLRFLDIIARNRNGMAFTEIQTRLDMPKSSAHSLIQELIDHSYLMYNPTTNRYYAGFEFVKMCAICLEGADPLRELQILTSQLGREIGQTTHACMLDGRSIRYLAKYETNPTISSMSTIGFQIPAHCCATGKVLLSQYTDEEIARLYDGQPLEMLTAQSINNIERLLRELNETRERGYGLEFGESKDLAACIALPLRQNGRMIAAFSVTYPVYLLQSANHGEIVEIMKKHQRMAEGSMLTV